MCHLFEGASTFAPGFIASARGHVERSFSWFAATVWFAQARDRTMRKEEEREVMIVGKDTVMVRKRYDRPGENSETPALEPRKKPGTHRLQGLGVVDTD